MVTGGDEQSQNTKCHNTLLLKNLLTVTAGTFKLWSKRPNTQSICVDCLRVAVPLSVSHQEHKFLLSHK